MSEFNNCRSGKFGKANYCRMCSKVVFGKWYRDHSEKIKERARIHSRKPEVIERRKARMQDPEVRARILERSRDPERKRKKKEYHDRPENKSRMRSIQRAKRFEVHGITEEDFVNMIAAQGGGCAICEVSESDSSTRKFHIDHDHSDGHVRGVLCHNCNVSLGLMKDNPVFLERAAEYIRKYSRHE